MKGVIFLMGALTEDKLREYAYPTYNWTRPDDGKLVDYVEIEIKPEGIKELEVNLKRYKNRKTYTEKQLLALDDECDAMYERIVAYVHFISGTATIDKLFLVVRDAMDEYALRDVVLSEDDMKLLSSYAIRMHEKYKNSKKVVYYEY